MTVVVVDVREMRVVVSHPGVFVGVQVWLAPVIFEVMRMLVMPVMEMDVRV